MPWKILLMQMVATEIKTEISKHTITEQINPSDHHGGTCEFDNTGRQAERYLCKVTMQVDK